jgi:hypothetical protein
MLTCPELIDVEFVSQIGLKQIPKYSFCEDDLKDGTPVFIFEIPLPDPSIKLKPQSKIGVQTAIRHKAKDGNTCFDAKRTTYRALLNAIFTEVELVIDTIYKFL